MLSLAQNLPGIVTSSAEFDTQPFLLNCENGTIDLKTGELRPYDPAHLISKLCRAEYDPQARFLLWDDHLLLVTGGDREKIEFIQTAVGYSATGDTSEGNLFFVLGPTQGGKETTLEAIKRVFNDYAATADFEAFLDRGHAAGVRSDIARLVGVRFVPSVEVEEGRKLAEGLVKQLTGGDLVTARFLYHDEFEFRPAFKLWLVANDAPGRAESFA